MRAEVDHQGGVILDAHDPAEAVLIMSHLVLHVELLSRRVGGRRLEGACGQETPGRGAGRLHHFQYAAGGRRAATGVEPLPSQREDDEHDDNDNNDRSDADVHR
jgi:hypothetical protein